MAHPDLRAVDVYLGANCGTPRAIEWLRNNSFPLKRGVVRFIRENGDCFLICSKAQMPWNWNELKASRAGDIPFQGSPSRGWYAKINGQFFYISLTQKYKC